MLNLTTVADDDVDDDDDNADDDDDDEAGYSLASRPQRLDAQEDMRIDKLGRTRDGKVIIGDLGRRKPSNCRPAKAP